MLFDVDFDVDFDFKIDLDLDLDLLFEFVPACWAGTRQQPVLVVKSLLSFFR